MLGFFSIKSAVPSFWFELARVWITFKLHFVNEVESFNMVKVSLRPPPGTAGATW
jgi:hypothetical protein